VQRKNSLKLKTSLTIWGPVLLLLVFVRTPEAEAATAVYYSVGTSVADLKLGGPTLTITISGGTATFSAAQATNVGVGDEITYNGATRAYISSRISSTQYTVTTATGATPGNVSGLPVNSMCELQHAERRRGKLLGRRARTLNLVMPRRPAN
jgi:hypothetical protein